MHDCFANLPRPFRHLQEYFRHVASLKLWNANWDGSKKINRSKSSVYRVSYKRERRIDLGSKETSIDLGSKETSIDLGSKETSIDLGSKETIIDLGSKETSIDLGSKETSIDMGSEETSIDLGSKETSIDLGSKETKPDTSTCAVSAQKRRNSTLILRTGNDGKIWMYGENDNNIGWSTK
jgi:hypothetical protein